MCDLHVCMYRYMYVDIYVCVSIGCVCLSVYVCRYIYVCMCV